MARASSRVDEGEKVRGAKPGHLLVHHPRSCAHYNKLEQRENHSQKETCHCESQLGKCWECSLFSDLGNPLISTAQALRRRGRIPFPTKKGLKLQCPSLCHQCLKWSPEIPWFLGQILSMDFVCQLIAYRLAEPLELTLLCWLFFWSFASLLFLLIKRV